MTEFLLVLKRPFERGVGHCWKTTLPTEMMWACDNNENPRQSPLALWEDDRSLGPAHAGHADIEQRGEGRYSFWAGTLYFSTSDNSDPNADSRSFRVKLRTQVGESIRTLIQAEPTLPAWDGHARIGLVGLGLRGRSLAKKLKAIPGVEIASLCDLSSLRIEDFVRTVMGGLAPSIHVNIESIARDETLDGLVIATPDYMHLHHATVALECGKPVFLEKPIATTADDARAIHLMAKRHNVPVQIGFVLRYSPFYTAIREVLQSGTIGKIEMLDLGDHLSVDHGASYRRRWHRKAKWSGGLIVHKGCHDLDLVEWLTGQTVRTVISTGGGGIFNDRPAPATHCSACMEAAICRHRFVGQHLFVADAERNNISLFDLDRCVYGLDQDIVEFQSVLMDLSDGARASLRIDAYNPVKSERTIFVAGELGTLTGKLEDGHFDMHFSNGAPSYRTVVRGANGSHGGGDVRSLLIFLDAITKGRTLDNSIEDAVRGVCIAEAAERSRREKRSINLTM